jgi:hypothetical protein
VPGLTFFQAELSSSLYPDWSCHRVPNLQSSCSWSCNVVYNTEYGLSKLPDCAYCLCAAVSLREIRSSESELMWSSSLRKVAKS